MGSRRGHDFAADLDITGHACSTGDSRTDLPLTQGIKFGN
jgi:hypothetical protein